MAKMVSFVNHNTYHIDPNIVESSLLSLQTIVNDKTYLGNYASAITEIVKIYNNVTGKDHTLVDIIKQNFNGSLTRSIYTLILQDALDLITDSSFITDFSKYYDIVEDKDDIHIESYEYGIKLGVFNTKADLKVQSATSTLVTRSTELNTIISKLGVVGTFYFFKALLKVVAVRS